jgi:hypothetical protein
MGDIVIVRVCFGPTDFAQPPLAGRCLMRRWPWRKFPRVGLRFVSDNSDERTDWLVLTLTRG